MKRTERHHLKENPLAAWLRDVGESLRAGGRATAGIGLALGLVVVIALAFGWQQWQSARASELLAAAMTIVDAPVVPPTSAADAAFEQPQGSFPSDAAKLEAAVAPLLAAADAYPRLAQGIAARYQAAAALAALGRTADADREYARVIELAGDSLYGRMARLGRAETSLQAGDYGQAIALLEAQTASSDDVVPVDAVLMRLGRAYQLAGQPGDAAATFTRLVDEHPTSSYRFDAERELDGLGGGR